MKKKVLTIALLVACTGNVSAQKWLKSIGKVLDKAEQVLLPESGKQESTTNNSASNVFDGTWCLTSESMEVYLTLTPKGEMNEEIEAKAYGEIATAFLPSYRMDNDVITSLHVTGNTAEIEYQCSRTGENGKAKIIYNPTAKTMKVVVTKAIEGDCYAMDITLKKCDPINEQ